MIDAHIIDSRGVYLRTETVDPMGPQPAGAIYTELPAAQAGYTRLWDGTAWQQVTDVEVPPMPMPPALTPTPPQFTSLEMLDLFTEDEQLAVVAATLSSPAVKLWYDRLLAASFITWSDPRTEAGLLALVDANLLTPERQQAIALTMQGEP